MKKVFMLNSPQQKTTRSCLSFIQQSWDKKLQVISKFKDERLQYFGKKLLYMEKPESLSKVRL